MIIEFSLFSDLITGALLVTCASPLLLIGLLIKDQLRGELW